MKTLVTVDFDGVVSPIDHDRDFTKESGWTRYDFGMMVDIHETVSNFLQELKARADRGEIDLIWNSSWDESTQGFSVRTDGVIPHFDHIRLGIGLTKDDALFQKLDAESYDRVVVLEDSSRVMRRMRAEMKKRTEIEALFIQPKVEIGLRPSHIRKVLNFLDS
jgi:FMN phosphatase YigB (HAD superfamily)